MEILVCIKAVRTAANQFSNNPSSGNLDYVKSQLEMLETVSSRFESLKPLRPNELATCECLGCLIDIVSNPEVKPAVTLQCLQIFSNLAREADLCKMMHESFNLEHTLVAILRTCGTAVRDQLTQVCLQLLQRVTYGHRISFHEGYVDELLKYLVKNILARESAVIQPCLGVLSNLCRDNFPIQARIKSMDSVKKLYRTVCAYFSGDLTSAVFAVSIFTSLCLNEEIGDEVFLDGENVREMFQLVFNALVSGDAKEARYYAVDLLQDLLRNPRLQQTLEQYPKLPKCIEQTLQLISSSPASSVTKVFELLTSFCSLGSLRSILCRQLFNCPVPSEDLSASLSRTPKGGMSPLIAVACWAAQPVTTGARASLSALEFMKEMFEEVLCQEHEGIVRIVNKVVLPVLVQILREPLSPTTPHLRDSCQRLSGALVLLTVLCTDDESKASVAATVKMEDFKSVLQFQMSSNKVLQKMSATPKTFDDTAEWESAGVEVVLLCMQLMSKIRRYVHGLEAYFTQVLQDNEMVPFLAKGFTSKERDLVQIAFALTCTGSSLDNFPDVILGDAIAAANVSSVSTAVAAAAKGADNTMDISCSSSMPSFASENKENMPLKPRSMGDLSMQGGDESIQALIAKMHSSIELKDLKTADIIEIYEHRLQSHQTKEDHLQDLLEAKSMALAQADRLIAQYRSRQARHGAEAHKMRCLFQEAERKNEGLLQEMNDLKLEKDRLRNDYDILKHEKNQLELKALELEELKATHSELCEKCEDLEGSLTRQQQELKTTQEMHEILQKHYESLKHQHDVASEQLKKLEEDRKQLSRTLKDTEAKLTETSKCLQDLRDKHSRLSKDREELEQEKETLDKVVDQLRGNISSVEHTNKDLNHKVKMYERRTQEQEESLKKYQDQVTHLEAEVEKHEHIKSLIQKLSMGQDISDKK